MLKRTREQTKLDLLDTRRVIDKHGDIQTCEGQAMLTHLCKGGLHMNETFFTKKSVMKMSAKDKRYINHEINCSIVCANFHTLWGHSRKWREFFRTMQDERYGHNRVQRYIDNVPYKTILTE